MIKVKYYNLAYSKYYIADSKLGTGLFIRVKKCVKIKQDIIVSFCQKHMLIQLDSNSMNIFI